MPRALVTGITGQDGRHLAEFLHHEQGYEVTGLVTGQANPKAGVAYVISKFGMAGLTQSINVEERANGIRACSIFPGDIDTPILDKRPNPPPAEARQKMLRAEDISECILLAIRLPPRAVVEEPDGPPP